eukprot:TRINITY_DN72990_c0_g1_i1.p1 TRINITY_DN72990_c0_g1~~TRINITY_DN72990_c0_g1_i1.p1  ORF type:complete len:226 (+),score=31.10 TRINITY_DN72990_c0_g1_i1:42-680(+)
MGGVYGGGRLLESDFYQRDGDFGLAYYIPVRELPTYEFHAVNEIAGMNTITEANRVIWMKRPPFKVSQEEKDLFNRRWVIDLMTSFGFQGAMGAVGVQFGPRVLPRHNIFAERYAKDARLVSLFIAVAVADFIAHKTRIHDPHATLVAGLQLRTPLGDHLRATYQSELAKDLGKVTVVGFMMGVWHNTKSVYYSVTNTLSPGSISNLFTNVA